MSTGTLAVTGGTGFIGTRLVERLRAEGRAVRCLVRRTSRVERLCELGAETVAVDLESGEGLDAALMGVEGVLHVAGAVRAWDRAGYERANVVATSQLAASARRAGVRRFVLVSSLAAVGPSTRDAGRDEADEPAPICDYGRSKLAGERALARAAGDELELAIVRPGAVYGPGDRDFFELFKLAASRSGLVPYAAPAGQRLSMVHVDDLVALLHLALERAPRGAAYFASDGGSYTWPDIVNGMGAALGRRVRAVRIPPALLAPAALAVPCLRPFRAMPPVLCADKLRQARQAGWLCSPERAARELGFAPRFDLCAGLADAVRWYRAAGWLPQAQASEA